MHSLRFTSIVLKITKHPDFKQKLVAQTNLLSFTVAEIGTLSVGMVNICHSKVKGHDQN